MKRLHAETTGDLARELGMTGYDSPRTVRRWLQDVNGPQYAYTMAMLEKAGWLTIDAQEYLQAAENEARKAETAAQRLVDGKPPRA